MSPLLWFLAGAMSIAAPTTIAFLFGMWWIARQDELADPIGPRGKERLP